MYRGDYASADQRYRTALAIHQESGDRHEESAVQFQLIQLTLLTGKDLDAATRSLRRLHRVGRELDDPRLQATALLHLGQIALAQGFHERAAKRLDAAYRSYLAEHHRHGQANALYGLSCAARARGDHVTASRQTREAIAIYREIGDIVGEAKALIGMGEAAPLQADFELAE